MCGHTFDPSLHIACKSCPLNKGCSLICCPQCGFEMVDIDQSKIVQLLRRFMPKPKNELIQWIPNLASIQPGHKAKVIGFADTIPTDKQAHLQSYGLIPGRIVQVVRHSPVTIIQVEHTELAIETEMAKDIQVEAE
jgi:Fe2+ transport system protein FeoA